MLWASILTSSDQHSIQGVKGATLYVLRSPSRPPKWADIFAGHAAPALTLKRPTFGAVLLVPASRRLFALTFGSGRHLLEHHSYERNFGLRVALNLVDPDRIRSAQSRTFVDTALQVRRQVAEPSDIVGLELDVQRDLLTTLEGTIARGGVGKRVSGADAARFTESMEAKNIPSVCQNLYRASQKTTYKSRYPWIDWISPVVDPDEESS